MNWGLIAAMALFGTICFLAGYFTDAIVSVFRGVLASAEDH